MRESDWRTLGHVSIPCPIRTMGLVWFGAHSASESCVCVCACTHVCLHVHMHAHVQPWKCKSCTRQITQMLPRGKHSRYSGKHSRGKHSRCSGSYKKVFSCWRWKETVGIVKNSDKLRMGRDLSGKLLGLAAETTFPASLCECSVKECWPGRLTDSRFARQEQLPRELCPSEPDSAHWLQISQKPPVKHLARKPHSSFLCYLESPGEQPQLEKLWFPFSLIETVLLIEWYVGLGYDSHGWRWRHECWENGVMQMPLSFTHGSLPEKFVGKSNLPCSSHISSLPCKVVFEALLSAFLINLLLAVALHALLSQVLCSSVFLLSRKKWFMNIPSISSCTSTLLCFSDSEHVQF